MSSSVLNTARAPATTVTMLALPMVPVIKVAMTSAVTGAAAAKVAAEMTKVVNKVPATALLTKAVFAVVKLVVVAATMANAAVESSVVAVALTFQKAKMMTTMDLKKR